MSQIQPSALETELIALLSKNDKSSDNVILALYKGTSTNKEVTNCLASLLKKNWISRYSIGKLPNTLVKPVASTVDVASKNKPNHSSYVRNIIKNPTHCKYFNSDSKCSFGEKCYYTHVPLCKDIDTINGCKLGKECTFDHCKEVTKYKCLTHIMNIIMESKFEFDDYGIETIQNLPDMYYRKRLIREALSILNRKNTYVVHDDSNLTKDQVIKKCMQVISNYITTIPTDCDTISIEVLQELPDMWFRKNIIRQAFSELGGDYICSIV